MENDKLKELINELAGDFLPMVNEIEKSIQTTQNHYGRYGQLISSLSKGNKGHANLFARAMIQAGANAQGVTDGLKCFT